MVENMIYLTAGQEKFGFLFDMYSKVFRKLGFKRYTLEKSYRKFLLHLVLHNHQIIWCEGNERGFIMSLRAPVRTEVDSIKVDVEGSE